MKPETIYGKVNIKSLEQDRNKVQIGDEDSPVLLIDMESEKDYSVNDSMLGERVCLHDLVSNNPTR